MRPSHFAKIKIGAKKDGTITAWQSKSWSTGGFGGGGMAPLPYVFTKIPNFRLNHTAVSLNAGPQRAWRAPNHPQASFLTCSALEDLAAKLKMDPLEFFHEERRVHARARTSTSAQLDQSRRADRLEEELASARRRQRAPSAAASASACTWGGAGHACKAQTHHQSRWLRR